VSPTYIERIAQRIREQVPEDLVPDGDADSLFLIYAVLALVKGPSVTARDVHNAWAAWMASRHPSHDAIRPFDDLPAEIRREDEPFVTAIRAASRDRCDPS
jgi:hypothetical protein